MNDIMSTPHTPRWPPRKNTWRDTIMKKIRDLELIASWASITNFDRVRDLCRIAQAELKAELESERCQEKDT